MLIDFWGDHNNIPIPSIKRVIPNQEFIVKFSPNKNTPNNAAVKGSAYESVTAVDEEIWVRPLAKSK